MESVKRLENKLNEVFVVKAPFQLPVGLKKWIGDYGWIFVLVGFIFGVISIFGLLGLLSFIFAFSFVPGVFIAAVAGLVSIVVLIAQLVLEGMSIGPLKAKQKRGWDLAYYGVLLSAAYSIFSLISSAGRSPAAIAGAIFSFVFSALVWVISVYILFQVRSQFMGSHKVVAKSSTSVQK